MTIDSYRIVTNFVFIWQIMRVSRKEKKMGGEQSSLKVYSVIASVCVCVCGASDGGSSESRCTTCASRAQRAARASVHGTHAMSMR